MLSEEIVSFFITFCHNVDMKNLAIIPARSGSKRIPQKNIKSFLDRPIISYPIRNCLNSKLFDVVMVSTDSQQIAEIALRWGAKVPFLRSAKNADDFATTADVVEEVLGEFEKRGQVFESVCCIYPTSVFSAPELLIKTFEKFKDSSCDALVPVLKFDYPYQRGFIINGSSQLEYKWPEYEISRSQDLEELYHDAGQFYWFKYKSFKDNGKILTRNNTFHLLKASQAQDIDTLEDWRVAELKYQLIGS